LPMISQTYLKYQLQKKGSREEFLAWTDSLSTDLRIATQEPVVYEWMKRQPSEAMAWLNTRDSDDRKALVGVLAPVLPTHDLQGSMQEYADSEISTKKLMAPAIAKQLYQQDPEAAWDWYGNLAEKEPREVALTTLLMLMAEEDPYMALKKAESESAGMAIYDVRNPLLNMLENLALYNPNAVQRWLSTAELDLESRAFIESHLSENNKRQRPDGFFPPTRPHSPGKDGQ